MEFDSVIKKRKSVKSFKNKRVSWKTALDAIDLAGKGPFAGNINNLKFIIVEEKDTIKKIAGLAEQSWISQSSLLILICSDETHLENLYGERGRIYSRQQAGAAIQTILLKIVDLGLAACWVGAYNDELIRHLLSVPKHIQIEAIIPIGYENAEIPNQSLRKRALERVTYWEKWGEDKKPYIFQEHEDSSSLK